MISLDIWKSPVDARHFPRHEIRKRRSWSFSWATTITAGALDEMNAAMMKQKTKTYHLVMTDIAMENPWKSLINGGFNGNIVYKRAIFHGYVK